MYTDEYKNIKAFITWCEDTGRTEWMGYYGCAEKVLKDYFKYKEKAGK